MTALMVATAAVSTVTPATADPLNPAPDYAWAGSLIVDSHFNERSGDLNEWDYTFQMSLGGVTMESDLLDGKGGGVYGATTGTVTHSGFERDYCGLTESWGTLQTYLPWSWTGPTWVHPGDAGGSPGFWEGGAFRMWDEAGATYFFPSTYVINSRVLFGCWSGPQPEQPVYNASDNFVPNIFDQNESFALVDDDPDPLHLVGTTEFGTGNVPGTTPAGVKWQEYSYKVTYDLTREAAPAEPVGAACDNGVDDDNDGAVDYAGGDPGCSSRTDDDELGASQCDNGVDDDGDGETDYRPDGSGDPGCESPSDDDETDPIGCADDLIDSTVTYKDITDIPLAPDVHWYTSKVHVRWCANPADGGAPYLESVKVSRHIEKGPVPRAIGLVGWYSGIETPNSYVPTPVKGRSAVTASSVYTACFDITKLFTKGLSGAIKKTMKGPLKFGIAQALKKAGLKKITPRANQKVAEAFAHQVNRAFKKGMVKRFLNDRFKIPNKIAGMADKAAEPQRLKAKKWVKQKLVNAIRSGDYEGATADMAASLIAEAVFRELGKMTAVCGLVNGHRSWFRTWDADFDVSVLSGDLKVRHTAVYLHPLMSIRRD